MSPESKFADRAFSLARLDRANAFLAQAKLTIENESHPEDRAAAASSAVLAGIAAADAACGLALGLRASGEHVNAVKLVKTIEGGSEAARALGRLVANKSKWQYSMEPVARSTVEASIRHAETMLAFGTKLARIH